MAYLEPAAFSQSNEQVSCCILPAELVPASADAFQEGGQAFGTVLTFSSRAAV